MTDPPENPEPRTLRRHREALAANPHAFTTDIPRAARTLISHIKDCGFPRATPRRCGHLATEIVEMIFESQERQPFFHVEGPLPFCWNRPQDWDKPFIRYEWGHLHSRNQSVGPAMLTDLCLQSARCNQHIQTSMDIEEVVEWLRGSPVEERVRRVLARREELFRGERWRAMIEQLNQFA